MLAGGIAAYSAKRQDAIACALFGDPGKIAFDTGDPITELPVVSGRATENAAGDVEFVGYRQPQVVGLIGWICIEELTFALG
jgi:hypothetical protein